MSRFVVIALAAVLLGCEGVGGATASATPSLSVSRAPLQLSDATVLAGFDVTALEALRAANAPNADGALSRNKTAYFSVRFQVGLAAPVSYGVVANDPEALEAGVSALRYAYRFQDTQGGFPVVPPPDLAQELPPPSDGDIASGHAFFLSEVGRMLLLLESSAMWRDAPSLASARLAVDSLRSAIGMSVDWLLAREATLMAYDAAAPNRLLFDAQALATTGRWLGRADAQDAARRFVNAALALQRADGSFIEGDGYDSSYQGVALLRALGTWLALPQSDGTRLALWEGIARGTEWQATRVLTDGTISLVGNARVFPGGERFLGEEKGIAWIDTVLTFWYVAALTNEPNWRALGNQVSARYR